MEIPRIIWKMSLRSWISVLSSNGKRWEKVLILFGSFMKFLRLFTEQMGAHFGDEIRDRDSCNVKMICRRYEIRIWKRFILQYLEAKLKRVEVGGRGWVADERGKMILLLYSNNGTEDSFWVVCGGSLWIQVLHVGFPSLRLHGQL